MVLVLLNTMVTVPQLKVTVPPPTSRLESSVSLLHCVTTLPACAPVAVKAVNKMAISVGGQIEKSWRSMRNFVLHAATVPAEHGARKPACAAAARAPTHPPG